MIRDIKDIILIIEQSFISLIYLACRVFPIKKNKVVFNNFYGRGYGDNPKYIAEALRKKNAKLDLVWLVNKEYKNIPSDIRQVKHGSLKAIYEMVTAKYWVDNCTKKVSVTKRKGQTYIATWHGGFALKKIGFQESNRRRIHGNYATLKDSKTADYFVSNSEFCTNELYRNAFKYEGEIIEFGSPRNDIILKSNSDDSIRRNILGKMNLDPNKRYLLYAPTFRDDGDMNCFDLDFESIVKAVERKFIGDWIVLLRLHPKNADKKINISGNVQSIDATSFDDMYELLSISDILITDYSSTMFELGLTGRPVFLYVNDLERYEGSRGINFAINELPYPSAQSNAELVEVIHSFDIDEYHNNLRKFHTRLGVKESGEASQKLADLIIAGCKV